MRTIRTLLKIFVSVGGLAFVLSKVPFSEISENWTSSVFLWLVPMLVLTEAGMLIQANRWKKMSVDGPDIAFRTYYAYIALGYFFNNLLPGGFGGDIVKSISFGKRFGNTSQSVAAIFVSRLLGLMALFVCFFVALPFLKLQREIPAAYHLLMLAACGVCLLVFALAILSDRMPLPAFLRKKAFLQKMRASLAVYGKRKNILFFAMSDSIWLQLLTIATNILYFKAVGVSVSWAAVTVFSGIIIIVSMIPVSINGIGIREGVQVSLYTGLLGIPANIVLSAGLLGYILLLFQIIQGAVVFGFLKKSPAEPNASNS